MICDHCGSPMRMQVQAVISAPSDMMHMLTKQNLRSKDVNMMAVLWETADYICTSPECGRVVDGYGNYVTNLEKEVKRLRNIVSNIEN